jgi:hypothetical protein
VEKMSSSWMSSATSAPSSARRRTPPLGSLQSHAARPCKENTVRPIPMICTGNLQVWTGIAREQPATYLRPYADCRGIRVAARIRQSRALLSTCLGGGRGTVLSGEHKPGRRPDDEAGEPLQPLEPL